MELTKEIFCNIVDFMRSPESPPLTDYLLLFLLWSVVGVFPFCYLLLGDAWFSSFAGTEFGGALWLAFMYWREE